MKNTSLPSVCGLAADGECSGRRVFLREAAGAVVALVGLSALTPLNAIEALGIGAAGTVRYPIPSGDSVSIDNKQQVILVRTGNEMYAFALSCPHQNTAIRALPGNKGFQYPRHKSRYQSNGTFINGKATRNMDRLPISRDGNDVVVNVDVAYESDRQPDQWRSAVVTLS